jgi:hypothetical protein
MAISFPKTWSSGEVVTASDMKSNLDAMKNKQQKLASSDIDTAAAWVQTPHIMQGRYDSVTNITNNVSGVFGGRNNGGTWQRTSYVTRWMMPATFNIHAPQFVPLTCIEVDLTAGHTVFFQWWINHQSPRDGLAAAGETQFYVYKDAPNSINNERHSVPEQPVHAWVDSSGNPLNVSTPALVDGTFNTNGHILFSSGSEKLNYGIGLNAWSSAGKCQQVSWGISIEVFYM